MTEVTEPMAVQVKFESTDTKNKKQTSQTEYTVFIVNPIADEAFCKSNGKSCLCSLRPCKADKTFFCKDDRFTIMELDNEESVVHHLF